MFLWMKIFTRAFRIVVKSYIARFCHQKKFQQVKTISTYGIIMLNVFSNIYNF